MTSRRLRVLLVGESRFALDRAADHLVAAGHVPVTCSSPGDEFPCRALACGADACPLDDPPDVAVVIRSRPTSKMLGEEVGAICAVRAGIPVVLAGRTLFSPFEQCSAVVANGEAGIVDACERVDATRRAPGERERPDS